jgi:hypothetical protein
MRWYDRIGRRVWPHEWWHFLFRDRRVEDGPTLTEFLGEPQDQEAEAIDPGRMVGAGAVRADRTPWGVEGEVARPSGRVFPAGARWSGFRVGCAG